MNSMHREQEKEMAVREKKIAKEMVGASKQVTENVKRTAELNKQDAEVSAASCLHEYMACLHECACECVCVLSTVPEALALNQKHRPLDWRVSSHYRQQILHS